MTQWIMNEEIVNPSVSARRSSPVLPAIDTLFPRLNRRFLGKYPLELGRRVCVSVVVLLVYYSEATVLVSKDQANL
jgi:hypothetical protein